LGTAGLRTEHQGKDAEMQKKQKMREETDVAVGGSKRTSCEVINYMID